MRHPLVDMAYQKYYCGSYINEPLIMGKASTEEEKTFKKEADNFVRNIEIYPHAFVLACLMDTGVDADVAWTIPYRIYKELGTFEINELYEVSAEEYQNMFTGENKWHRYPVVKSKVIFNAIHKIVESEFMNGDASRIWTGKPSSRKVVLRFMDFKGCGFKIANMAPNILCRYFGVEFSDYSFIDIAPDIHTMRVFQRLGLTPFVGDTDIARIYTIAKARELNPEFPGIVDGLCWEVGREFCNPRDPKCEKCPFGAFCKKDIVNETDVWR